MGFNFRKMVREVVWKGSVLEKTRRSLGTSQAHLGKSPRHRKQQGQRVINGNVPVHLKTGKDPCVAGAEWGGEDERKVCRYVCGGGKQEVRKLAVLMFLCWIFKTMLTNKTQHYNYIPIIIRSLLIFRKLQVKQGF